MTTLVRGGILMMELGQGEDAGVEKLLLEHSLSMWKSGRICPESAE